MPELPEVEVVRVGLQDHAVGRQFTSVQVTGVRTARRHLAGAADLSARLTGSRVLAARRRGKYLWLELDADAAMIVHLGMSGQMLIADPQQPLPKHCHARFDLSDGRQLRFIDQRTFGGLALDDLGPDPHGSSTRIPSSIGNIAPDPFDEAFDLDAVVRTIRRKQIAIKRALLDQDVVSGIGNIYADEALWLAKLHGERRTDRLSALQVRELIGHARVVMEQALAQGGTSFDSLYVNVNGASGYFERSLNAYGRQGQPCPRCGTLMRRESFMNRSSHSCPRCQRRVTLME